MTFYKMALGLGLIGCLLTACGNNISLPVSTSTSRPEATASLPASPTPETPLVPITNLISVSPNGFHGIACQFPELVLFDLRSGNALSRLSLGYSTCQRNIRWSRDRSYAILVDQEGIVYQWPLNGDQPVELDTNIDLPSSRFTGHANFMTAWSQDGRYLALVKECNILITQPFGGELLQHPLKVGEGCGRGIEWATYNVLMVDSWPEYKFYQIPTGNQIGHWSKQEGCLEQVPSISPNQRWMIFHQCDTAPHFNQAPNDQYLIADLEQGSIHAFSGTVGDYIDFIGWKDDGAAFYFISRSVSADSSPDPRTPFGLLALDPSTGEVTNLFEQVWFAAFNKDLSWAFVVFPATNADGTLRLDGGLWQVGTSEIKGRQVMDSSEGIRLNGNRDVISYGVGLSIPTDALLSPLGEYLGASAAFHRLLPAAWSNDNTRVALINDERQVTLIDLSGEVQIIGQLDNNAPGIYGDLAWSHDDRSIIKGDKTFPVP